MKKAIPFILAAVVFFMVLFICISCGKGQHTRKILREDVTVASMNCFSLIKDYGVYIISKR
jgi:p-aminobenzoyl-glutamate transporter AbgT